MRYLITGYMIIAIFSIGQSGFAWGGKGHVAVGDIAQNFLTENSRKEVAILLGGQSLGQVASWADRVKHSPGAEYPTATHYINLPRDARRIQMFRDSNNAQNVVDAIERNIQILSDKNATKTQRRYALMYLVHFIGDIHQPLHASYADDRGGSDYSVQLEDGSIVSLHGLFDAGLIYLYCDGQDLSEEIIMLIKSGKQFVKRKHPDNALAWAEESFTYTRGIYNYLERNNAVLSEVKASSYYELVKIRIGTAGLRLAGVINIALETN